MAARGLRTERLARLVRAALNRPRDPSVCSRCNGMGGIYVGFSGGRTFVNCPECKGARRGR